MYVEDLNCIYGCFPEFMLQYGDETTLVYLIPVSLRLAAPMALQSIISQQPFPSFDHSPALFFVDAAEPSSISHTT